MDKTFTSYKIEERSYVAFIKREIHIKVVAAKFSEKQTSEIDIVVSEITSNLIKHAANGELLYRISAFADADPEFEIICIDKGPGIDDTVKMMKDGVSTTKTLGQGLGAIERLSSFFQIFSVPKWGTILYARISPQKNKINKVGFSLDVKSLCVNKPRELVCGDGYHIKENNDLIQILFGDGLGHGEFAKEAVDKAGDSFFECSETEPVEIIRYVHQAIRKTRGLVGSVAVMNKRTNHWSLCGVGNILTRMYSGIEYKNHMSYNGTIGLTIPNSMKSSVVPVERNQHLIMCSDGIQSRWDLSRYPSIFKFDNIVLAAALYKDFSRGTDDTSTLIAKVI